MRIIYSRSFPTHYQGPNRYVTRSRRGFNCRLVAIAKVSTRSNGSAHARTSQSSIIGMADALVAKFEVPAYKVESETLITLAFDFVDVNPELGN